MFPRIELAIKRLRETKPSVCLEKAKIMTEVFMQTEGEPLVIRRAKAFREICRRKTIFINDGELIVGHPASKVNAAALDPDVKYWVLSEELDTIHLRDTDQFLITNEQKKLFKEFIEPYWRDKSFWDTFISCAPEDLRQLVEAGVLILTNGRETPNHGLLAPNYELIIREGVNSVRERIERKLASLDLSIPGNYEKWVYLKALLIVCEGIVELAKRYALLAREKAEVEKDPQRREELEKIAEICAHVPANPARNFWEALQSLWFYHVCLQIDYNDSSNNPGRVDQYLYPYYKRDIEEGRLTKEQALELIECLFVKFNEIMYLSDKAYKIVAGRARFQSINVGGITKNGGDGVNELTYLMIEAMKELKLPEPHFGIKYNKRRNPDLLLIKAAELVMLGTGHPQFFNDEAGIKYLMGWGIPFEDAYNWSVNSCKDLTLMGKIGGPRIPASINLGSAVELVLTNGMLRKTGSRLPVPQTGDPRNFKTFEDFKKALKRQLAYLIKKAAELANMVETIQEEKYPYLVASLSFEDCIENARDCMAGGAKYNIAGEISSVGHADLINSVIAVKKLIYDEKRITWEQLLEALDKNFEGYEDIQALCLTAPKYGNDVPEIDEIAADVIQFLCQETKKYSGRYGGKRVFAGAAAAVHIYAGSCVGALPSGRKAWTPLSDGISPMQGTDVNGPTAVLKDASKCCLDVFYAPLLNMKLDPSLFRSEKGIQSFVSFMKAWADLGIYHIQFNVVSPEVLREAQVRPEKYRDLMVRVSGYCTYFVDLPKEIQDEIISRTTHRLS
ncbi:MAG: formate C-acetyltransferase/glycerol dehydratase family glycyl radical enzyme [Candidatus Bathyarchaeia archaeon]|nr:formate C-acetyltransferase/glycerol dehydratase family glycyl radical enzyme [Candidatus Bathyarchaeota archaeon]